MRNTITLLLSAFMISTVVFSQTPKDTATKKHTTPIATKYTCPMDRDVMMDKPGKCPKCGMDLVPVKKTMTKKMAM